jgi:two-component system chemotaxis response regulator CheY
MPYRLLVVDDSSTMRKVIRKVLSLTDLPLESVDEAGDGAEALKRLRSSSYDLVLADLNMPVMDGRELLEAMGADPALRSVPVIVVSSEGDSAVLEALHAKGAREVVRKPFEPVVLRRVIERTLGTQVEP